MKRFAIAAITVAVVVILCIPAASNAEFGLPVHGKIQYAIASWYGHNFHGKTTASGAIFDMHEFTCAHRTLPFGTLLKITNIFNNKSTFCVVNDRGPFMMLRSLDVSFAAARVLDMISLGISAVRIEYIGANFAYMSKIKSFLHEHTFIINPPE